MHFGLHMALCLAAVPANGLIQATEVTQALQRLDAAYRTELNIFINLEVGEQQAINLELLDPPCIQVELSEESSRNLRVLGRLTQKVLIIVYLKGYPLDDQVLQFLPRFLWRLNELQIVFVTPADPSAWEQELFDYCFSRGFINVLLVGLLNQTVLLRSYTPYPRMQILRLARIEDYLERSHQRLDLWQHPIRTLGFQSEPRIFQYVNRKGEFVYGGYMLNIMREFARQHNSTVEVVQELPHENLYAKVIEKMERKEVEFVCYPRDLHLNTSFTIPVYLLRSNMAVPFARPIAKDLYFARPFTWTLWLAVIGTIGYGMLMLYGSNRTGSSEIGEDFMSSWCHLLFISPPKIRFANWQHFTIHFMLMLSGFILTNFYKTLLSSMLTSGLFEPQLNTLQDLLRAPYPLLVDDYYADFLLNTNFLPDALKRRTIIGEVSELIKARMSLNSSYMYVLYDDRLDVIFYQQHLLKVPRFKVISEKFMDGLMAIPVSDELPYLNKLNHFIRRIFDLGIFSKMMSDAWRAAIEGGLTSLMGSEKVDQKPYDLSYYYYAFGLWAVGLALGSVCFLLELLRARMTCPVRL